VLTGNALANTIVGGAGGDTLNGSAGNDTLTGGAGNDFFRFQAGFGNDAITDFDTNPAGGQDLIDLTSFNFTAADFSENGGTSVIVTGGVNAVITVLGGGPAGGVITLSGVNGATINTTDFRLA
jgi:Ca2+-binding RTX toxin-like protein